MDELSIACIDTHMRDVSTVGTEEDEVAGLKVGSVDGSANTELLL
jgi:hypothetical protein